MPVPPGRRYSGVPSWWVFVAALAAAAGAVLLACWDLLPGAAEPRAAPAAPTSPARAGPQGSEASQVELEFRGQSVDRTAGYDESGFGEVRRFLNRTASPSELLRPNHLYIGAGYRAALILEDTLHREKLSLKEQLDRLLAQARLYLYEGDWRKAGEVLAVARRLVDADPAGAGEHYEQVRWVQGVTALRRAEAENCVACGCEGSCIFPLGPGAYHAKPQGARDAIRYFGEYLQIHPDYLGARWLLNLAHMALGEYPDRMPPEYLIPLEPFQSAFDLGRFRDVAAEAGVNRLNMSGGAIFDDFDNDGLPDLVTTCWDDTEPIRFYHNRGDGTFEDRTARARLQGVTGGLYCVQTDYNNDGWLDIFIPRGAWKQPRSPVLLRNNRDGTFTDVTQEAGLSAATATQVACWADYDNDGRLDLFLGSEPYRVGDLVDMGRCRLYHNRGDGTFEDVALKAGVACPGLRVKGACWGDFDGDGYPDLFVSVMGGRPRLFHNNRDGTFTDVAERLGITQPRFGFSCWWFDYDNDGWPDLFVTSFDHTLEDLIKSHLGQPFAVTDTCHLYRNLGGKGFEDVTERVGLRKCMCPMGSNFADVDNDGWLDFYLGTGAPSYSILVPNRLFRNVGGQRFADITTSSGTGHLQKGHAVSFADYDRDGRVDLFVEVGGATPGDAFRNVLFRNPAQDRNHWVRVKLVGVRTNRAALGARIQVTLQGGTSPRAVYRWVTSGSSFGANALEQTIGLGRPDRIAKLEVFWPTSGTRQIFTDVPLDASLRITEFQSSFERLAERPQPSR